MQPWTLSMVRGSQKSPALSNTIETLHCLQAPGEDGGQHLPDGGCELLEGAARRSCRRGDFRSLQPVQQASLLTALSEAPCQLAVCQAVFSRTGLLRQAPPQRSVQGRPREAALRQSRGPRAQAVQKAQALRGLRSRNAGGSS